MHWRLKSTHPLQDVQAFLILQALTELKKNYHVKVEMSLTEIKKKITHPL